MILQRVREIIAYQLGEKVEDVEADMAVVEDLGADSLDVVELAMALEEEYDIEILEEDMVAMPTPEKIAAYIEGKVKK